MRVKSEVAAHCECAGSRVNQQFQTLHNLYTSPCQENAVYSLAASLVPVPQNNIVTWKMKNFQFRYNVIPGIHTQKSKHYMGKTKMRFTLLYAIFVDSAEDCSSNILDMSLP
jgi:hypothetical protein